LSARVERLRRWGYAAELIGAERASVLAPDLKLPASATIAYFPEEGWVAVPVLIHALLEAAARDGVRIVFPAPVDALAVQDGRVVGARVGERVYEADVVIDCSGPRAGCLVEPLGLSIARQRSPGILAISEPLPTCLAPVVHFATAGVYFRPDGAGRIRIGSEEIDSALPADDAAVREAASPGSAQADELLERARSVFPPLAGARLEAVRLGWRALPGDGFSAVGPVPGLAGYYLVFTHSGVTLGPLLGRLVADELQGTPADLLAEFRPDRLVVR
ncbi:MAG TPA: FAD-binding oxidoreductase, partial [Chloroflexota bacterium]|nr:FAD-binding oxidoreductase [Chloroflexota bacterium]